MNNRRLNVRFNLDNPDEERANDYLESLAENNKQSRNRFIVEAVIEKIKSHVKSAAVHILPIPIIVSARYS